MICDLWMLCDLAGRNCSNFAGGMTKQGMYLNGCLQGVEAGIMSGIALGIDIAIAIRIDIGIGIGTDIDIGIEAGTHLRPAAAAAAAVEAPPTQQASKLGSRAGQSTPLHSTRPRVADRVRNCVVIFASSFSSSTSSVVFFFLLLHFFASSASSASLPFVSFLRWCAGAFAYLSSPSSSQSSRRRGIDGLLIVGVCVPGIRASCISLSFFMYVGFPFSTSSYEGTRYHGAIRDHLI